MNNIEETKSNDSKWENTKLKLFEICQQVKYMPCSIEELISKIEQIPHIVNYAWILHDKDQNTEPHYHIMILLNNAYTVKYICKQLDIPSNIIERGKTNFSKCVAYLIHRTPSAINKYQYGEDEIHSNVDIKQLLIQGQKEENAKLRKLQLIADIQSGEVMPYQLNEYFDERNIDPIYRTLWKKDIDNAHKVWIEDNSSKVNRNMEVIYINGASGTGKTTFVKDFAEKVNKPLYNCSSNLNDLFSGYKQQPIVVIDDIQRGLPYSTILKLLDNNTSSLYKSRYYDKSINSIELLFITSTYPIEKIFSYSLDFEMKQIRRRIKTYLIVSSEFIDIYKYNNDLDKYDYHGRITNPLNDYINRHKNDKASDKSFIEELNSIYTNKEGN